MGTVERYTVSEGTSVLVAIPDEEGVIPTSSRVERAVLDAVGSLGDALKPIRAAADEAVRSLRDMSSAPARIEIQLGVCLTGQTSAIIASTSAGAQMTITVIWERPE
jgi:hypothetical protein